MRLFYGGAEINSHRAFLTANGIKDMSLSYMGLRRRVKFARPWAVADKFADDVHVLLDSGAYSVNEGVASGYELDELASIATAYEGFVAENCGRVDAFTEFDALPLGLDWIAQRRRDLYDDLGDKFLPVWHAESGVDELERMAAQYKRVAILQIALGDRDLIPVLNMLAERRGTLFHGLSMTKPAIMRAVKWDSVGSTSWLSTSQYGDTFVWTGRELKRYPKAYKEQARKRHRTLFTVNGFDAAKIAADDTAEVSRLALWSWQHCLADINAHDGSYSSEQAANAQLTVDDGDDRGVEQVTGGVAVPEERGRILLPGIAIFQPADEDEPEIRVRGESMRRCDTCFLRERNCPGYKPGAACLYNIPIEVRTREQLRAVENGIIEMQTQRVMFMRMVEDLEGGFPDPNLSSEIDRLTRMIKMQREGTAEKFNLSISATNRPGELGALSRIFGDKVAEAQALAPVNPVDEMIRSTEVFEAEIVE